ncbi:MAG: YgiT-type zinc finger domain-containing protein [Betaproteobacteria bacterium RIFCSPLOWO2_12_FULL_65_14]|nr:MAG: YgiT-type zinc finger domain-containing protein [Betaproteobacteria bacterium RIFCSPLOWO2_12_FULL_65_14]
MPTTSSAPRSGSSADPEPPGSCASCGSAGVHESRVRSAFWHQERLVVVEDIPALVCAACGERFYDDATVIALDLLRGEGFPPERARDELRVGVFSLADLKKG